MKHSNIDHGKTFDWGLTSCDYARYRDIYPKEFYQKILDQGLCIKGQTVLDIGTGTGVLPRNLYEYGASFTGIDLSENQIKQAISLAEQKQMKIHFQAVSAETCGFSDESFHVITACQCFTYFDHPKLAPHLYRLLKPNGTFVILYMAWLLFDDNIAGKSEELILKYNPVWTGCKETRHPIALPECYSQYFSIENQEIFDLSVPFTRESWHGRIKTCRGVEASLSRDKIEAFDIEHTRLLNDIAPENFQILHYAAIATLKKKDHLEV